MISRAVEQTEKVHTLFLFNLKTLTKDIPFFKISDFISQSCEKIEFAYFITFSYPYDEVCKSAVIEANPYRTSAEHTGDFKYGFVLPDIERLIILQNSGIGRTGNLIVDLVNDNELGKISQRIFHKMPYKIERVNPGSIVLVQSPNGISELINGELVDYQFNEESSDGGAVIQFFLQ